MCWINILKTPIKSTYRDVLVENNEGSLYAQIVTSCCSESEPAGVHILELCDGMYWLFYISCLSGGPTWRMFTPRWTTDVALQKECKSCSQNANQKQNRQKLKQLENIKGITNKQYLHLLLWICTCTKSQIRKTKQRSNFLFLVSSMT